jgi:hypothetical protein
MDRAPIQVRASIVGQAFAVLLYILHQWAQSERVDKDSDVPAFTFGVSALTIA